MPDYSYVDQPYFLQMLFYPRPDFTIPPDNAFDLLIDTGDDARVAARFYSGDKQWPWILYFHGNGEVASDYDDLSALYFSQSINLVVADYRGYGSSSGTPDFTSMVNDAHHVYGVVKNELEKRSYNSDLYIMGRSLGSISALELAFHHQKTFKGLIIESGFASINRLIYHLGIMKPNPDLDQIERECLEMIAEIRIPALIIHGGSDNLVLPGEGKLVYDTLGSSDKEMVIIPRAGHNDVIVRDIPKYFGAIKKLVSK
ncbi:temperature sensitive supressor-like [hydrocarbon metagenome]|uniref:Temperature sensitive supressor-like n=1 Tax=hydrocarbon metagenome TaxID=938273 RepID=A0A0W8E525_9ZZZZ